MLGQTPYGKGSNSRRVDLTKFGHHYDVIYRGKKPCGHSHCIWTRRRGGKFVWVCEVCGQVIDK